MKGRGISGLIVLAAIGAARGAEHSPPLPPLPQDARWINSEPLTNDDLLGKVVMLDVWTFG